jgi:flavin-dependent dehydrogenase
LAAALRGLPPTISLLHYGAKHAVTLIERSALDNRRVGEHVSAGIFELLQYLQLKPADFGPGTFLPTYGNTAYWGIDQPILRDSIFTTESASYQLDRDQFDLTLLNQVSQKGGTIFPRTKCTQFVQLADKRWKVGMKHPVAGAFTITAKFLIDASGRNAHVCRQIGIGTKRMDQLMAVGAVLQFGEERVLQQDVLLETVENGWWYSATLSPHTMTIIFFSDADLISENEWHTPAGWNKLLQTTSRMKQLVRGAHNNGALWVRSAHTQLSNSRERENFLAIGDAAASFDPVSSMGIGFAITSACHAAAIVQAELSAPDPKRIEAYQQDIERNFENYHALRQRIYQQEQRWPLSTFWMRRNRKM